MVGASPELAYRFDDVVFALHDERGQVIGHVYGELHPEGEEVMFSLLKPPVRAR